MKVIRFFSDKAKNGLGQPALAKKFLPKWYRESETITLDENKKEQPGLKKCIPFLDSMISGYMLVTPVDIFISKNKDKSLNIRWNSSEHFEDFISERAKDLGEKIPRPAGHYPNHLAFRGFWGIKTPKGWSTLVVQPLNRFDLPWTITSGIMDTDQYSTSGNIPFFVREDFEGMVPAGTPFAQLLPIKRESWKSINNDQGIFYLDNLQGATVRSPGKSYKKLFWIKKDYN